MKKLLSILLSLIMIFSLFTIVPFTANAADSDDDLVGYVRRSWDGEMIVEEYLTQDTADTGGAGGAVVIGSKSLTLDYAGGNPDFEYWYYVDRDMTIPERLYVNSGTVNIILCDDTTLTLGLGITVGENATLNIYGQENNTGKLYAHIDPDNKDYNAYAIIGGGSNPNTGTINIHGGILDLHTKDKIWGYTGACIGGGRNGSPKAVTVYGGKLELYSSGGACIGGGKNGDVSRAGGEGIRIYGGTINAESYSGAAIGSGQDCNSSSGTISIYGGSINATGIAGSAGIGGGDGGSNGPIEIYGGNITASGLESKYTGSGIGSGSGANQTGSIRIHGGVIVATAQTGAGIGAACGGDAGTIEISRASVVASSTAGGAGIGGGRRSDNCGGYGGNITISSGANVVATSSSCKKSQDLINQLNGYISRTPMKSDASTYSVGAVAIVSWLIELFDYEISGAGIGGGYNSNAGTITISDSTVIAKSGVYAAAIGTGEQAAGDCTINIKDYSVVTATSGAYAAGIGTGYKCAVNCKIDISGHSTVTAEGGYCGTGIGGGDRGGFDTIDIKGSKVNATGGDYGAGIGSGNWAERCGTINIIDSEITAESGTDAAAIGTGNETYEAAIINITGSTVTAHSGGYGAGIGGGDAVSGGVINITDSTITEADSKTDGAGIGGGEGGNGGVITISNSDVTAHGGGYAAGIGGGDDANGGTATIIGSKVKAYGGTDAAGIGGGEGGNGGKIVIEDSEVYAQGSSYGAGIGGGESEGVESVTIKGDSKVTAIAGEDGNAAAIGHGDYSPSWAAFTQSYPSNGKLTIDPQQYFVRSGESSDNTTTCSGNDIYDACREKKYVYAYSCPHTFNDWHPINEEQHAFACLHCGREHDVGNHSWRTDNICRICHASAQMIDVSFVEQNDNGEEIQRTVSLPSGKKYQLTKPKNIPDGMGFVCWAVTDANVLYAGDEIVFGQCEDRYRAVYAPVIDTTYIDKDGYLQTVSARVLPVSDDEVSDLYTGWYVVNGDIAQFEGSGYSINGDVNLILADDVTVSSEYFSFNTSSYNNRDYTFTVYGQAKQTGKISKSITLGEFCNYVQYGGIVKTGGVTAKNCTIAGGVFEATSLNVTDSIQLGWSRWNDSITVSRYVSDSDNPAISVIEGKKLRIQSDMTRIQGELGTNDIRRITGHTLVPDVDYRFQTPPQWEWSDNNMEATATFKNLGGSDAVVRATVEHTYDGPYKISTASVQFLGVEYTDSQALKVCWNVINKTTDSHGTVTISASTAKSNDLIKVTATPDPGYKVKSITAVPVDSSMEVDFVGKDSFVMPKCDVKVTVEFEPYFAGHSLSLKGDIGVNFYCALTDEEAADGAAVDFVWTVNGVEKTHSVTLTPDDKTDIGYKASCPIAVAEMTYEIIATLTIGNKQVATDTYSARQYANIILRDEDFRTRYTNQTSEDKYNQLVTLVKTMLDYGSKAQIRFDRNTDDLVNGGTDFFSGEVAFTSGASDMNEYLSDCGLEYVGTSVVYLTETTLRHYYRIVDGSKFTDAVKSGITFDGETVTYGTRGDMIYFDKKDIAASQLDTEYVLNINGHDYHYSALDYSALSYSLDDKPYSESITKQLAASIYRYNQAADAFFND